MRKQGFTLIELSIVLVIIGLVIGGVMAGRDLIRANELRSLVSQKEAFDTAVMSFRLKYNALPGDMTNATDFWGTDAGCTNSNYDATLKAATCNGDGDGQIGSLQNYTTKNYEIYRFWQHLANAGLIAGQFNGISGNGIYGRQVSFVGINVPGSKINKVGWSMYNYVNAGTLHPSDYWANMPSHAYVLGKELANLTTGGDFLTGQEAFSIDQKIDDGKPYSGKVQSFKNASAVYTGNLGCLTTDTEPTAAYITDSTIRCPLILSAPY